MTRSKSKAKAPKNPPVTLGAFLPELLADKKDAKVQEPTEPLSASPPKNPWTKSWNPPPDEEDAAEEAALSLPASRENDIVLTPPKNPWTKAWNPAEPVEQSPPASRSEEGTTPVPLTRRQRQRLRQSSARSGSSKGAAPAPSPPAARDGAWSATPAKKMWTKSWAPAASGEEAAARANAWDPAPREDDAADGLPASASVSNPWKPCVDIDAPSAESKWAKCPPSPTSVLQATRTLSTTSSLTVSEAGSDDEEEPVADSCDIVSAAVAAYEALAEDSAAAVAVLEAAEPEWEDELVMSTQLRALFINDWRRALGREMQEQAGVYSSRGEILYPRQQRPEVPRARSDDDDDVRSFEFAMRWAPTASAFAKNRAEEFVVAIVEDVERASAVYDCAVVGSRLARYARA